MADLKRLKVGTAVAILDDGLTINDCGFAAEIGSGANDARIAVTPIISVAAKDTRFAALNHHLRAVAIVFDFVNPVLALWWLIDRGGKLWLDESETGVSGTLRNTLKEEAPDDHCQGFFHSVK